jgi:hypothetical protein
VSDGASIRSAVHAALVKLEADVADLASVAEAVATPSGWDAAQIERLSEEIARVKGNIVARAQGGPR